MPRTLVVTLGLGLGLVCLLVTAAEQQPSAFGTLPFVDERFQGPQVCMCNAFMHQEAILATSCLYL